MDELIGRLVADVGVDRNAAETVVGIILDFLAKEGPPDKVQAVLAKLPGARPLMEKAAGDGGGVVGAGMRMMGAGLSMGGNSSLMHARKSVRTRLAGSSARFPVSRSSFE